MAVGGHRYNSERGCRQPRNESFPLAALSFEVSLRQSLSNPQLIQCIRVSAAAKFNAAHCAALTR